jgi:hypothetical protein
MHRKRRPGGIVKAEGLGDGLTRGKIAIAKLRLTMPLTLLGDVAFVPACSRGRVDLAVAPGRITLLTLLDT